MKLKSIICFILTFLILSTCFTGLAFGATIKIDEILSQFPFRENEILNKDLFLDEIKRPIIGPIIDDSIIKDPIFDDEIEIPSDEPSREFPSEYCMRDEYVVLAQNQDNSGYCWNFAATMSMTTAIMKATNEYYDFSELWHGLSAFNCSSYSQVGAGGSLSTQYNAVKNYGVMLESDLPYINFYIMTNGNAGDYYNFYNKYANDFLSDSVSYSSYSRGNVDDIKQHIIDNGSVYLTFSFKSGFLDGGDSSYYLTPNQKNTNSLHAVSVVGWDDNYQREFYLDGSDTPTVFKGAWIILNSYTEKSGQDGLSFVFYDDKNISTVQGYKYEQNTAKDFYFYDKIENGYNYPTNAIGKYYGDFTAESGLTKQKNIFYDDVDLEYSYICSDGTSIKNIEIYLNGKNVTKDFTVSIDNDNKRFYISEAKADYGQYKVLVTYGNGEKTDTYLNNFFVTYGLVGEEIEFDYANNDLGFNTGRELELYSYTAPDKNFVIYTNKTNGKVLFLPTETSVYSDKNMSIPEISYQIGADGTYLWKHIIESNSGHELIYNFNIEYYEDSTLQPVYVYYNLDGGVNHQKNYNLELASATSDLVLYEPTREGYTFGGWYLDYGSGSVPLKKDGDAYYIDWDDITHMGESPNLFALSHYKNYYKNSSVVFVYAHWEEENYHDINLTISGNGSCQMGEKATVKEGESVRYLLKPDSGHCLSELKINGVPVSHDKLRDVANNGLLLENVSENISIDATFSNGIYLTIDLGENIKNAYVTRTENGETLKFYNGECITFSNDKFAYASVLNLVVEVYDDENGYTYILENIDNYTPLEKGIFAKTLFVNRNTKYLDIKTDSAVKVPMEEVTISYTTGSNIIDHYLSTDKNATSGEKNLGTYLSGQVVYLFIKVPFSTSAYYYDVPDTFEDIGNDWYRRTIYIKAGGVKIGKINATMQYREYTITWENWDGTEIYSEEYYFDDFPFYYYDEDHDNKYPQRPDDEKYTYTFIGWSPLIDAVYKDTTYTAVYKATPKEYVVNVEANLNGSVISPNENNIITCEDVHTYFFIPNAGYKIKDVLINGVSVGAVSSYTFKNVCSNQDVKVEYEPIKINVSVSINGKGSVSSDKSLDEIMYGEGRTLVFSAENGWQVSYVYLNGEGVLLENNQLVIENIQNDVEILVFCEETNVGFIIAISAASFIALLSAATLVVLIIKMPKKRTPIPGIKKK